MLTEQNTKNKVSIIIYVHDGEKTLKQCIDSCLQQTHQNKECIIVNDAALKKTPGILKEYRNDPRLKIIDLPRVSGLGYALNAAFANAAGDYLMWIKDTVMLEPSAVEQMVGFMNGSPNIHFVYANHYQISEKGEKKLEQVPDHLDLSTDNAMSPCFLYTKKVKEEIGLYYNPYEMAADYDYWIRVSRKFHMARYPHPLCTVPEIPYYGRRLDRAFMHLFKRFIRYNNDFLTIDRLIDPIQDFDDRIKKHAKNSFEHFALLVVSDIKFYRISLRTGLAYDALWTHFIFKTKLEPWFKGVRERFRNIGFFVIGLKLKKNNACVNILCLIPGIVVGGSEKVTKDIIEQTRSKGYSFHLLAVKGQQNSWCRAFLKIFDNVILLRKSFNHFDPQNDEEYYAYLKFMIQKLGINIILISNPLSPYRCLERLKTEHPLVKVVDLLHVVKFAGTSDETLFAVPFIDKRICISDGLKEHMKDKYEKAGIDLKYMDRMTVIHNGNDMDHYRKEAVKAGQFRAKYNIDAGTKIISYVGRLSSEKRPIVFVDIAEKVLKDLPQEKIKFVMAGDGVYRKAVEARIKQLGLEKHFILAGVVTSDDVRDLLADAFVVLITSYMEGLPLVAVEAMSMSVPVISTDVGSIKEAVAHGVSGFLVHPQQKVVESFSEIICRLCSSKELYESVAGKTREGVCKEFSFETFAERYTQVFNELSQGAAVK